MGILGSGSNRSAVPEFPATGDASTVPMAA
jgi:hypothetical protein